MNLTIKQLESQFNRALKLGWLPFFVEAVRTHTGGFFDEADLMAIASRETNLDPKWLTKPGDNGNGFGLMQGDRRSFPEFTKGDGWKDARTGILFGAKVLMAKWTDTMNCVGKYVVVRSSKGGVYGFTGKHLEGAEAQRVTIAAYNSGRWGHYCASTGRDIDSFTTGKDYSGDVIDRAKNLRPLIQKWKADNLPATSQNYNDPTRNHPSVTLPSHGEGSQSQQLADQTDPNQAFQSQEPSDDFLNSVIDKNITPDQVKTTTLSFGQKLWRRGIRPLSMLYAALEAGNIYAWLGITLAVIFTAWLIYSHREDLKKIFLTLKNKLSS